MLSSVSHHGVLNYQLHYSSRRRSVALQIKQGKLIVRAPLGYSIENIEALMFQKQNWILKHLQHSVSEVIPDWLSTQQLPKLGQRLKLEVGRATKSAVTVVNDQLIVAVSCRIAEENLTTHVRKLLRQHYQKDAALWFSERVCFWQQQMQLQAGNISIGNWRTKWGYCRRNKELGFNWRLLMAPQWIADYVIVHELAHLIHLNHSAAFWALVAKYYPQHKAANNWLKHNAYWMDI